MRTVDSESQEPAERPRECESVITAAQPVASDAGQALAGIRDGRLADMAAVTYCPPGRTGDGVKTLWAYEYERTGK